MEASANFWSVSLAQIVTWLLIIAGAIMSMYVATRLLGQRMDNFDSWRQVHEKDAKDRDQIIKKLEVTAGKLTTLAEAAEKRLERLEYAPERRATRR